MANDLVAQFLGAVSAIYGAVLPIAQNLFVLLAAISVTWAAIWLVLEKDDPLPIFVSLLGNLMRIAFFWFVLINANVLSEAVVNSFVAAGQTAAAAAGSPGVDLSPTGMLESGSELASRLYQNVQVEGLLGTIAGALLAGLLALLLFSAFVIVAGQIAVSLIEGFVVLSGGVILLGFTGSPWTAQIGMRWFSAVVAVGIKLFMVYVVVGLGAGLTVSWPGIINAGLELAEAFELLGTAMLFAFAAWSIPSYASNLVSGVASSSLQSFVSSAATMGALATGGASLAFRTGRMGMTVGARGSDVARAAAAHSAGMRAAGAGGLGSRVAGATVGLGSAAGAAWSNAKRKSPYGRMGAADWLRNRTSKLPPEKNDS